MATKLHKILAVERDVKQSTNRRITDGYKILQKPVLLQGIARSYRPKDEDGEQLPSESTHVQVRATEILDDCRDEFERLWNLVATKDFGNTIAKADVKLEDGTVLIANAPTSFLLWLEKQLTDLHTIISKLPQLDPTEQWTWNAEQNCFATNTTEQHRTKKIPRVLVKAPATDKHQADTEVYHEDVVVGYWSQIKYSGALRATDVRALTDRVLELTEAVKKARSEANEVEVEQQRVASPMLDYLFAPLEASA